MQNIRVKSLDVLKGILIVFVVLGHVAIGLDGTKHYSGMEQAIINYTTQFIYSFHMPAFFAISGFLFFNKNSKNIKEFRRSIIYRLITLGIPYIICSLLYWILKFSMNGIVEKPINISSLLLTPIKPIEFFWFIYALMIIYIIIDAMIGLIHNKTIIFILLLIFSLITYIYSFNIPIARYVLKDAVYFYLGYVMAQNIDKIRKRYVIVTSLAILIIGNVIFYNFIGVKILTAFAGSIFVVATAIAFERFSKDTFIGKIGRNTMLIYLTHVIFVGGTRTILFRMNIYNLYINILLGMLVTTIGSAVVWAAAKKIPALDFIFYPNKYIKYKR